MRIMALVTAALLGTCTAGAAADLPAPPIVQVAAPGWGGFYVGLNAGGAMADGRPASGRCAMLG